MANRTVFQGIQLVDIGGGNFAEKVVAINADGSPISGGSVTAGTEYTEGNTDATITGTAVLWEDTSDTLRAVSAAKPLPVNIISGSPTNTEYTEGATDSSITGSAMLWEDGSDTLRAISDVHPLPVQQAALASGTDSVTAVGTVAHDAVDTGNPLKIGGKAASTIPTAVAAGDRVDALYSVTGKQVVLPYALGADFVSGATSDITNTTATTVVAAPAAGLRNYITHILVQNSHATVSTWVNITEETSGTVLYTIYAPALGGGASVTLPSPVRLPTTAKAVQATCVTTGSNVRVSASGYAAT